MPTGLAKFFVLLFISVVDVEVTLNEKKAFDEKAYFRSICHPEIYNKKSTNVRMSKCLYWLNVNCCERLQVHSSKFVFRPKMLQCF